MSCLSLLWGGGELPIFAVKWVVSCLSPLSWLQLISTTAALVTAVATSAVAT